MTATSDASSGSDEDRTALTDTVTRFARTEIAPHVDAWDAAGEFPRSLSRRAADLGLLGLGYPEPFGGTRDAAFADQRVQGDEQVEIEAVEPHAAIR